MAIDPATLEYLTNVVRPKVRFDRTLTLGRQNVFAGNLETWNATKTRIFQDRYSANDRFAEPIFRMFGASKVDSIDAFPDEGATIVKRLDGPAIEWCHAYDFVFDGGTLEHVFDLRCALANVSLALTTGGHACFVSPTTNYSGHGFYQFSPQFFTQGLPVFGLEVLDIRLCEYTPFGRRWFAVDGKPRPTHTSPWQACLFVLAVRRAAPFGPFQPMQEDYATGATKHGPTPRWAAKFRELFPGLVDRINALRGLNLKPGGRIK